MTEKHKTEKPGYIRDKHFINRWSVYKLSSSQLVCNILGYMLIACSSTYHMK